MQKVSRARLTDSLLVADVLHKSQLSPAFLSPSVSLVVLLFVCLLLFLLNIIFSYNAIIFLRCSIDQVLSWTLKFILCIEEKDVTNALTQE